MNGWDKFFGDKKRLIAKQSAQIPCCEKAKRTSILLQKSKAHRYLAVKKQSAQIPCCEFARKFKAFQSLELPQRFCSQQPAVRLRGYFACAWYDKTSQYELFVSNIDIW